MFRFKTLKCTSCQSVIANLPEAEIIKLIGLSCRCECCNTLNELKEHSFVKVHEKKVDRMYCIIPSNAL